MEVPAQIFVNTFVIILVGIVIAHSINTISINRNIVTYASVNYTAYQIIDVIMQAARKAHTLGEKTGQQAEASALVFIGQPYIFTITDGTLQIQGFDIEISGKRITEKTYKLPTQLLNLKITYRETSGDCDHIIAFANYNPKNRQIEITVISGTIRKE